MLDAVRRLTERARGSGDEADILTVLTEALTGMPSVSAVRVWPPDGDGAAADVAYARRDPTGWRNEAGGRALLPVFAHGDLAAVVAVDRLGPADDRWITDAETLASAASASLTARRAARDARTDVLTQVLSRTAMDEALVEELARARRTGEPLSLVFLDVDRFKTINDDLGHAAGDAVLREVGGALRTASRPYDHVARFGGDEFVVIAPATDVRAATALAERLRDAVALRASAVAGRSVVCSAGVGEQRPGLEAGDLLDLADHALRAAKRGGRDRVMVDQPAPDGATPVVAAAGADCGADLQRALAGEGLSTHFQALRDLRTGVVIGYEALSRGPGSLRRPDHLLSAGADVGVLIELDEQLRRQSFDAAVTAGMRPPATLFVNIERTTLLALPDDDRLWPRGDVDFPSITEITERALFAHPGRILRACRRLRELGWGVAVDDVGQDPRALALLPLLAPDVVKLDLRVLQDRAPVDVAMVTVAVTAHVRRSRAAVVAEGIERQEQLERARALGATLGQGWLFGRPSDTLDAGGGITGAMERPEVVPVPDEAVTPFERLAADAGGAQLTETALLGELQAHLERRALGMGPVATLITLIPAAARDARAPRRLEHLAHDIGFTALLHPDAEDRDDRGFVATPLPADHPAADEWVAVVTCPHYALAFAARPAADAPGRWTFVIEHDAEAAIAAARSVLLHLR